MEAFGYVYTLMDSFFAGLKTIPHRASIHTEEQWFWHDFYYGVKLRASLSSGESHIG